MNMKPFGVKSLVLSPANRRLSGSKGRKEARIGVMIAVRAALKELGIDITKTTANVQGLELSDGILFSFLLKWAAR